MAASGPPPPPDHPKTNGSALLEPPPRPPAVLSAEQDPPGNAPILIVIYTKEASLLGRRFVLDQSPIRVGRAAESHIVLRDTSVSSRHAHFEAHDDTWWCVDDGSTDGVYIDDRRTDGAARLAHGTRIGIGSTIFKFLSGRDLEAAYHEEIYRVTLYDGLTQVYVRRYLLEALGNEILRARRHVRELALLMIEIDDLGATDRPNASDHVVREVAGILRRSVARDEILARFGHRQFVLVLADRTLEKARDVAESLREKVASSLLAIGPEGLKATVCIGGAQYRNDDRTSADLLERASRALQLAKSRGRSQLECSADEGPHGG
jgi:diguanylate cyclase (GGDEF)-like protein